MLNNGNLELGKLAIAESMVEGAELNLLEPDYRQTVFCLSRFAYQHLPGRGKTHAPHIYIGAEI